MSNRATTISAKYCLKIAQIEATGLPVFWARDIETQIGQKILKIWDSE